MKFLQKLIRKIAYPKLDEQKYTKNLKSNPGEQTERERRYITMQKIIKTISSNLDFDEVTQEIVNVMVEDMSYPGGILFMIDKNKKVLIPWTTSETKLINMILTWLPKRFREYTYPFHLESNKIIETYKTKGFIITESLSDFISPVVSEKLVDRIVAVVGIKSTFAIPVTFKEEIIGILMFNSIKSKVSNAEREMIALFADMVGIAMKNSTMFSRIDKQVKQLAKKNSLLKIARRREQDMMDIMGHELRTPLSIIRMSLGILKSRYSKAPESITSEVFNKYEDRISEALSREISLLERMLSSTKIDADRMQIHLEKVNLKEVLDESVFVGKGLVEKKGLKLECICPGEQIEVYADKIRLAEVLDNLINNAIKYTEKGKIRITFQMVDDYIYIIIKDTGIGIPEEAVKHLGKKFYRVSQYTNEEQKEGVPVVRPGGTGLGLYVSFELIELMGGKISVKSELGKGSEFTLSIPIYKDQKEVHSAGDAERDLFKRMGFTEKET